mgnify:FL=1
MSTANIPPALSYTAEHEWVLIDGETATVGITDFAAQSLGDVVFVALPSVGTVLTAGAVCGEVESTKSVSELFAPVAGVVVEVNESLESAPEVINADAYGEGWLFRVETAGLPDDLLDAAGYAEVLAQG